MNTIGDRIKEIRKHTGMKQKDLASYLNVSSKQIWSYETNALMPPIEKGVLICALCGCSIDYLYFGTRTHFYEEGFKDGYNRCREDIEKFLIIKNRSIVSLRGSELK